jgi:hypothetical protein
VNDRDTNLPGNVWKLDITGTNATLRTRGESMDVSFKGSISPKVAAPEGEQSRTKYIIGGIIGFALVGTGIYLVDENRKRNERRRKRRRSLLVDDTDTNTPG